MEGLYIPDYYECECGGKLFKVIAYSQAEYDTENPIYAALTCVSCNKESKIDIEDSASCWGLVQSELGLLDKTTIKKLSNTLHKLKSNNR